MSPHPRVNHCSKIHYSGHGRGWKAIERIRQFEPRPVEVKRIAVDDSELLHPASPPRFEHERSVEKPQPHKAYPRFARQYRHRRRRISRLQRQGPDHLVADPERREPASHPRIFPRQQPPPRRFQVCLRLCTQREPRRLHERCCGPMLTPVRTVVWVDPQRMPVAIPAPAAAASAISNSTVLPPMSSSACSTVSI